MPSIRRSLGLSFARSYTGLLITVPTIMVLARFLTPEETGIFSVALSLTNLAHMLRDFGVADYLIQERRLTKEKIRAAFTVTLISAWAVAAILFVVAPFAARFYQEPGVKTVLYVLAVNFLVIPFGSPALSLLRRDFAFGSLYIINTGAALVRSLTSIGLAVLGFSYMSLAWGSLAGVAATTLGAALSRPRETWLIPGLSEWRAVVSFGSKKTVIDISIQLAAGANDLAIGRLLGFGAAGLFSRGAGLVNLFRSRFQGAISSVAFPAFASRRREGGNVNALFVKSIAYVTAIAWPFYAFAAIMAYPIILAAYGPQWIPAVPVLRLLAIGAAIATLNLYTGQLLMASGHINSFLGVQLISQPSRVGLIILAAFYSIEAVAAVQIVMAAIGIALQYNQLRKKLDLHFLTVLQGSLQSAGIAAISSIVPAAVLAFAVTGQLTNPWIELTVAAVGGGAGWLLGIFGFKHPLAGEMLSLWRRFGGRRYLGRSENHG